MPPDPRGRAVWCLPVTGIISAGLSHPGAALGALRRNVPPRHEPDNDEMTPLSVYRQRL